MSEAIDNEYLEKVDHLIATEVMGWGLTYPNGLGYATKNGAIFKDKWDPSDNLKKAWRVVEVLRGDFDFHLSGEASIVESPRWRASVTPIHNGDVTWGPYASTPALAICLLALQVNGVDPSTISNHVPNTTSTDDNEEK